VARATRDVIRLLDAFGMDVVLVETVGVGQTELAIVRMADTTVVVLVPEAGDAVQVMKAGLLEIADLFVVNKADREGAERMQSELVQMLHLRPESPWRIPVLLTTATAERGLGELLDALARHRDHARVAGDRARRERERRESELLDVLDEEVRRRLERGLDAGPNGVAALLEAVRGGDVDPYTAALRILDDAPTLEGLLGKR
jgi:LAO/AO transport system kinase